MIDSMNNKAKSKMWYIQETIAITRITKLLHLWKWSQKSRLLRENLPKRVNEASRVKLLISRSWETPRAIIKALKSVIWILKEDNTNHQLVQPLPSTLKTTKWMCRLITIAKATTKFSIYNHHLTFNKLKRLYSSTICCLSNNRDWISIRQKPNKQMVKLMMNNN